MNLSSFALQTGNIGKVKLKCRISLHAYLFPTAMEYIVTDSASAVKAEPWLICFAPEKRKTDHYILNDFWKDLPAESYLYSSAFSGDYQSEAAIKVTASADGSITFRALCPCLHHKHQVLAISGDCPALGNWDIQKTVLMEEIQPNEWTITLNVSTLEFPLSYKFVTCNADSKQVEDGRTTTTGCLIIRN